MRVNESAAASTKIIGAAAIISRALYRMLTIVQFRTESVVSPKVGEGADDGLFGAVDDVFERQQLVKVLPTDSVLNGGGVLAEFAVGIQDAEDIACALCGNIRFREKHRFRILQTIFLPKAGVTRQGEYARVDDKFREVVPLRRKRPMLPTGRVLIAAQSLDFIDHTLQSWHILGKDVKQQ